MLSDKDELVTEELKIAIEALYKTFAPYTFKTTEGSPLTVTENDKETLHSKPLRELEDEDISKYAFKAMTTWGDTHDFKHYLPRIFELAAARKLVVDTFVILGKLDYANWHEWHQDEIDVVLNFLNCWWKSDINHNCFDEELLIEINKRTRNLTQMLSEWILDVEKQGFKNFVELIAQYYYDLRNDKKTFDELGVEDKEIFLDWIKSNTTKLEEGFFYYEKLDAAFSSRISDALYLFERSQ